MARIITLTTDFGLKDPYHGTMKGVILSINPGVSIVDISHLVSPGNILEGSFILLQAYSFFPEGTIHVGVVDPGVGGRRRPVVVETERYFFVGPDNGLFDLPLKGEVVRRVVHLTEERYFLEEISSTFHGRDIFAPVAAHLSLGRDPSAFGRAVQMVSHLHIPEPVRKEGSIHGRVIYIDTFGNLITNIEGRDIDTGIRHRVKIEIGGISIEGMRDTYSCVGEGEVVALVGSCGFVEIACFRRRADEVLGVGVGEEVCIVLEGRDLR